MNKINDKAIVKLMKTNKFIPCNYTCDCDYHEKPIHEECKKRFMESCKK